VKFLSLFSGIHKTDLFPLGISVYLHATGIYRLDILKSDRTRWNLAR
jgi:hypothetical protein